MDDETAAVVEDKLVKDGDTTDTKVVVDVDGTVLVPVAAFSKRAGLAVGLAAPPPPKVLVTAVLVEDEEMISTEPSGLMRDVEEEDQEEEEEEKKEREFEKGRGSGRARILDKSKRDLKKIIRVLGLGSD